YKGVCDGAILRARLDASDPSSTIQPYSWGYRNGFALRFAPQNHVLKGALVVGENGPDERGARPSNGAPDAMHIARQNDDGTPDSSFTGIDFVPDSFVSGSVHSGALLYILEGDLGFSAANSGSDEVGHEVKVVNFLDSEDGLVSLNVSRFAKNNTADQAFITG